MSFAYTIYPKTGIATKLVTKYFFKKMHKQVFYHYF